MIPSKLSDPQFRAEATLLCTYKPLIHLGRKYVIYHHPKAVFAEVIESNGSSFLPVRGYPDILASSPNKLKRYLSHVYCTLEESVNGQYRYVRAVQKAAGGMFNGQDQLPWYPGYTIGHIIKKTEVEFPVLKKRLAQLKERHDAVNRQEKEELRPFGSDRLTEEEKKQETRIKARYGAELNGIEFDIEEIEKQLDAIVLARSSKSISFEESLPIDHRASPVRSDYRSSPSEQMAHLLIKGTGDRSTSRIMNEVERFVGSLLPESSSASFLPTQQVQTVSRGIEGMLKDDQTLVSLVGSFITLPYVRTQDPIVFRKNSQVSQGLKENMGKYYVLSEAVLGALFIGYGYSASAEQSVQTDFDVKKVMSKLSVFSFISYGAIPTLDPKNLAPNLLEAYLSWHDTLLKDTFNGYPIAYRYRELKDVLEENELFQKSGQDAIVKKT